MQFDLDGVSLFDVAYHICSPRCVISKLRYCKGRELILKCSSVSVFEVIVESHCGSALLR